MPVDTKRICGPEQTSPYYLHAKSSNSSTEKNNETNEATEKCELAPMFVRTGVVSQAKGSAYIEIGSIKIVASVYGPREVLKKEDFSINGQLNCEVKYAPYSCPNIRRSPQNNSDELELSKIVCDAIKPAVCMQKFPKSRVDIFVMILESGDSALGAVITCASLATADAGIEMYDVVIGSTLKGGSNFGIKEEYKETKHQDTGSLTIGLLPSLDQISCFVHKGEISSDSLAQAMKTLINHCHQIYPVIQSYLLKTAKKETNEIKALK